MWRKERRMYDAVSFGQWLKQQRKARDLTQANFARLVGCAIITLRKVEADALRPSRQIAERIADQLTHTPAERTACIAHARGLSHPSVDGTLSNLPAPPTPLIGRGREIAALIDLLQTSTIRLVTLTGPAGTGKTRLAIQAAAELLALMHNSAQVGATSEAETHFDNGIWFVNLAPIHDPSLVATTIAHTLGVPEVAGSSTEARLCAFLRAKCCMLLLDNFEQVLDAAPLIAELLATAPGLKVLVTSRATLHLSGEHEFLVEPLALPPKEPGAKNQDAPPPAVAELIEYAAIQLFMMRAQAANPGFAITATNAQAIVAICRRLDGLPLAIELAAARVKLYDPAALLERLDHPLQWLTNGPRDLPARQQTMRATIDWSYNLLNADEQRLFRRLGVFVGGCTLEAAAEVCGNWGLAIGDGEMAQSPIASPQSLILDGLALLVDSNLLKCEAGPDGAPRFVMLATIHGYALERLNTSGEVTTQRQLHAAYYLALTEQAQAHMHSHGQKEWLERLEAEIDNLRAVLSWSLASGDVAVGVRIAGALEDFWLGHGHMSEGRRWLDDILAQAAMLKNIPGHAKALMVAGFVTYFHGDKAGARARYEESLAISTALQDQHGRASALVYFGWVEDDPALAWVRYEEALAVFRSLGDRFGISWALGDMGLAASDRGEYALASSYAAEALALARDLGDRRQMAYTLWVLGVALLCRGDYTQASRHMQESLALSRALGDVVWIAYFLGGAGEAALYQGDYTHAAACYEEAVAICREVGDNNGRDAMLCALGRVTHTQGNHLRAISLLEEGMNWISADRNVGLATELHHLAAAVYAQGDHPRACALLHEALVLQHQRKNTYPLIESLELCAEMIVGNSQAAQAACLLGAVTALRKSIGAPLPPGLRAGYDRAIAAIHAQIDRRAFVAAWAEGQAMSLGQALEEAQSLIRKPAPPIRECTKPDGLISDAQWQRIAAELPPTPKQHTGRPRLDDRRAMTAIFYALETGCSWKALPRGLGAPSTIHDRFCAWRAAGVFERLWQAGLLPNIIADRLALRHL
jgi:predicted ATPase/transposase/DNA-binding XRE family transcriptional regulator